MMISSMHGVSVHDTTASVWGAYLTVRAAILASYCRVGTILEVSLLLARLTRTPLSVCLREWPRLIRVVGFRLVRTALLKPVHIAAASAG